MTERVRIEHTFNCDEKAFWTLFLDEEYNREMFLEGLRFNRWEVTKLEESETEVRRSVVVEPRVPDLPGPIKKVIGDSAGYEEIGRFNRATNRYSMDIVPTKLKGKLVMSGEQFTEALGDNQVKRIFTADIKVKVFGVGSMIEKQISSDLQKSYNVGAKFTVDYMRRKGIG